MIWTLLETTNEIIADGPEIKTPSGKIKVVDIDTVANWIKKLIYITEHPEYYERDPIIIKDARKFLEYLYA